MTISQRISIPLLISSAFAFATNTYACDAPTIIAPKQNETLATSKPTIAWLSNAGNDPHEIEVIARVPEGEVIQRIQRTIAGSQWQADAPLTNRDATVSLRVTRRCADQRNASTERNFHISFAGACPTPSYLSPTKVGRFLRIEWQKAHPIKMLEMRSFFGEKVAPGESVTTDRSPALLELKGEAAEIVGVRAQCESGFSDWAWMPVIIP